jgi:hypothetical protein
LPPARLTLSIEMRGSARRIAVRTLSSSDSSRSRCQLRRIGFEQDVAAARKVETQT